MAGEHRTAAMRVLQVLGPFLGLFLVVALFWKLRPESFPTPLNFKTIAVQTVIVGVGALGMTFVIASGGIDLSVGSVMALASVTTALCLREGVAPSLAVPAGMLTGGVCGLVSGVLVAGFRVVPFIATLGTMGMARGLAKLLAEEQTVVAPAGWIGDLLRLDARASLFGWPPGVWLLLLLAALMAVVLRRTPFGLRTLALGSNEATALLCGVPVKRTKVLIYVLSGLCAGLSGVFLFSRLTVGDPTGSLGEELNVIAACVIGGASLSGGTGSILGSMVGAVLMAVLANGCTHCDVPNYVQEILVGAIIVVAVMMDRWR